MTKQLQDKTKKFFSLAEEYMGFSLNELKNDKTDKYGDVISDEVNSFMDKYIESKDYKMEMALQYWILDITTSKLSQKYDLTLRHVQRTLVEPKLIKTLFAYIYSEMSELIIIKRATKEDIVKRKLKLKEYGLSSDLKEFVRDYDRLNYFLFSPRSNEIVKKIYEVAYARD